MSGKKRKKPQPERRRVISQISSADEILEELRALCLSLPETTERNSWGHPNFVAGRKTFVTFEQFEGRPSIAFRFGRIDIARFSKDNRFFATPYGRGQWFSLWLDTSFDRVLGQELVITSYRSVALKRMLAELEGRIEATS